MKLKPEQRSIGLLTADNDDATYVSIDEATKMADVEVVYAHSFYAGAKHSSGLLSGEIIAILAGPDPAEVRAGMQAAKEYLEHQALWYSANSDGSIAFFPHLISRTGSYLSQVCGIPQGDPVAYLIAPPLEGLLGMDAGPQGGRGAGGFLHASPSETNYMGVMLTGDQPACKAAAQAFGKMVLEVARNPIDFG